MSAILEELELDGIQAQTGIFRNLLRMRIRTVGAHSQRIATLARDVSRRLQLSSRETRLIDTASELHDLGTIAIPDPILHKPGRFTDQELQTMRNHTLLGYEALRQTPNFREIADIVLHHHEWFNGSGYPHGFVGEEIPFGSRLISVLDAYDAMTGERTYKERRTSREAAEELIMGKGTQFDPEIVDAVLEAIRFGVH